MPVQHEVCHVARPRQRGGATHVVAQHARGVVSPQGQRHEVAAHVLHLEPLVRPEAVLLDGRHEREPRGKHPRARARVEREQLVVTRARRQRDGRHGAIAQKHGREARAPHRQRLRRERGLAKRRDPVARGQKHPHAGGVRQERAVLKRLRNGRGRAVCHGPERPQLRALERRAQQQVLFVQGTHDPRRLVLLGHETPYETRPATS